MVVSPPATNQPSNCISYPNWFPLNASLMQLMCCCVSQPLSSCLSWMTQPLSSCLSWMTQYLSSCLSWMTQHLSSCLSWMTQHLRSCLSRVCQHASLCLSRMTQIWILMQSPVTRKKQKLTRSRKGILDYQTQIGQWHFGEGQLLLAALHWWYQATRVTQSTGTVRGQKLGRSRLGQHRAEPCWNTSCCCCCTGTQYCRQSGSATVSTVGGS